MKTNDLQCWFIVWGILTAVTSSWLPPWLRSGLAGIHACMQGINCLVCCAVLRPDLGQGCSFFVSALARFSLCLQANQIKQISRLA